MKYEARGELGAAIYCHCSRCRKPTAHDFVASKAEWYEIHDDLPPFAERQAVM